MVVSDFQSIQPNLSYFIKHTFHSSFFFNQNGSQSGPEENSFSSISALEIEKKHTFYPDFFNIYQWINENFQGNTF